MRNNIFIRRHRKILSGLLTLSTVFFLAAVNSFAASYVSLKIYPEHVGVFVTTGKQQFVAFGVTATGAQENITDKVEWVSSNESLVKIDTNGLATIQPLITAGQVKITCNYPKKGGITGATNLLLKKERRTP